MAPARNMVALATDIFSNAIFTSYGDDGPLQISKSLSNCPTTDMVLLNERAVYLTGILILNVEWTTFLLNLLKFK